MQMLICKPVCTTSTGIRRRAPVIRQRARKFGPITQETTISVRRDLLISGANSAGKSRWLSKLHEHSAAMWIGREAVMLRALEPLQRWTDDPRLEKFAAVHGLSWAKLAQHKRTDLLCQWIAEEKAVLFLDDVHKLTGRKLDLVCRMARDAGLVVAATWAEQSTPMSLRMLLDRRDPQRVQLKSEAAYDITSMALWLMILVALGAGAWQLAAALGGMKVLGGGRRAARQS